VTRRPQRDVVTEAGPVVRFEDVGFRYDGGQEVLSGIGFTLQPGSFHYVTGGSGAGKSSLLALMHLARTPTRGRVSVFGQDVATLPRRARPAIRRRIGVVFQDFRLLDHLSALDNVALPLRVAGRHEEQAMAHCAELLGWVGLGDLLDARPPTLSGGQKQRVAIARAVINNPRLLIADEPTGSVDDQIAERLMVLFEELNRMGTTVVIATHNRALVEKRRHPELRLEDGRLRVIAPGGAD